MRAKWNQERSYLWRLETGVVGMSACVHITGSAWPKPYHVSVCGKMSDSASRFKTLREAKAYGIRTMKVRAKKLMAALA